jgi:hypothetical protein
MFWHCPDKGLKHMGSQGKKKNTLPVLTLTNYTVKSFRDRSVHFASYLVSVSLKRHTSRPAETKIRHFDRPFGSDEQILWLQVPVEYPSLVEEPQPLQKL